MRENLRAATWKQTSTGTIYTEHGALVASVYCNSTLPNEEFTVEKRVRCNAIEMIPHIYALLSDIYADALTQGDRPISSNNIERINIILSHINSPLKEAVTCK